LEAFCYSLVVAFFNEGRGQTAQPMGKSEHRDASQNSDRGKYIVEDIAICGQCHTPRDSDGAPDRSRWLEGAPVWLKSAEPVENWPLQAPRIAGALPGTDAEMVTLLTTGIWRGGYLRPPMPQFSNESARCGCGRRVPESSEAGAEVSRWVV